MQTWTCFLDKLLVAKDGEALVSRTIELPFVPHTGLRLMLDNDESEETIESVVYDAEGEAFYLHCESDEFYHGDCPCKPGEKCCEIAEFIAPNVERGWTIEKTRKGDERVYLNIEGIWR